MIFARSGGKIVAMSNKKILIAVPTYESIEPACFKSIYGLERPDGAEFSFDCVEGYGCALARNAIARKAIDLGYDYVFMVDSDIVLPQKALSLLLLADKDIIMGWYPSRLKAPGMTSIYRLTDYIDFDDKSNIGISEMPQGEVVEIKGGGFGCTLIKTSMLRGTGPKWFEYVEYPAGDLLSEDLYFCHRVRTEFGYKIFAHTSVRCGHICKMTK